MPITQQNMPHCWLVKDSSVNPPQYSLYYAVDFNGYTPTGGVVTDGAPINDVPHCTQLKLETNTGGSSRYFGVAKTPHTKAADKIKLSIYGMVNGKREELGRCVINYDDADPVGSGGGPNDLNPKDEEGGN